MAQSAGNLVKDVRETSPGHRAAGIPFRATSRPAQGRLHPVLRAVLCCSSVQGLDRLRDREGRRTTVRPPCRRRRVPAAQPVAIRRILRLYGLRLLRRRAAGRPGDVRRSQLAEPARVAAQMFESFSVMRQLHELLWYLLTHRPVLPPRSATSRSEYSGRGRKCDGPSSATVDRRRRACAPGGNRSGPAAGERAGAGRRPAVNPFAPQLPARGSRKPPFSRRRPPWLRFPRCPAARRRPAGRRSQVR